MSEKRYAKTPTVFQMEATECAAAALTMVLAYFGRQVTLEQMRIECGVSRDGSSAKNIMRAGKRFGLEVHAYRKDIEGLLSLPVPCIIHWNFHHFVVWEGVKGKYCYINDPAAGRRKLSMDVIDSCFTGVVLTFKKTSDFMPSVSKKTFSSFIRENLRKEKQEVAALMVTGLLLVFPGMLVSVFSQIFVDGILVEENYNWFTGLIGAMIFTMIFRFALSFYRQMLLLRLQNKMTLSSAHAFLDHFFKLPISFFEQRSSGDLSKRVENNNNVNIFLTGDVAENILNVMVSIFYLIILLLYSPLLTAVGVGIVALNLLIMHLGAASLGDLSLKFKQDEGKMLGSLFAGILVSGSLKASGTEAEYASRLQGYYAKSIETEQKIGKRQEILDAIPEVAEQVTSVVILILGGILVIRGEITEGVLVAFNSLLAAFMLPINELAGFAARLQGAGADARRVEDVMSYREDPAFEGSEKEDMGKKLEGRVSLRSVSFGYSALEQPLIKDFGFDLDPGSSIAIVGESGSGKSTVSKLISGLYRQWSGEILFDGVKRERIPEEVLSSSISVVSQNITLFSGSIRDNLTMWDRSVSETDVIRAAKDACIHDIITLRPAAYDYPVAEEGENFSGGQRQRLEIARALAKNPSILIMDEATSALDPITEKQILDNIKRRGCTCIMVAHRLSAIRDCDEILVMEKGSIVQRGRHEDLIKEEGCYRQLVLGEGGKARSRF